MLILRSSNNKNRSKVKKVRRRLRLFGILRFFPKHESIFIVGILLRFDSKEFIHIKFLILVFRGTHWRICIILLICIWNNKFVYLLLSHIIQIELFFWNLNFVCLFQPSFTLRTVTLTRVLSRSIRISWVGVYWGICIGVFRRITNFERSRVKDFLNNRRVLGFRVDNSKSWVVSILRLFVLSSFSHDNPFRSNRYWLLGNDRLNLSDIDLVRWYGWTADICAHKICFRGLCLLFFVLILRVFVLSQGSHTPNCKRSVCIRV